MSTVLWEPGNLEANCRASLVPGWVAGMHPHGLFWAWTGLGDAIKIWCWASSNTSTSIWLLSRSPRKGKAWNRQKLARFEILFKLPMASQPWNHQASESGESAFEDGSRLDLEILTQPSVKFNVFSWSFWWPLASFKLKHQRQRERGWIRKLLSEDRTSEMLRSIHPR